MGGGTQPPVSGTAPSRRVIALTHLGDVVHEVHAGLVGLGVRQLEERGHPEADGVRGVAALNHTHTRTHTRVVT